MVSKRDQQKTEKGLDKLILAIRKSSGGKMPDWLKGTGLGFDAEGQPQVRVSVRSQEDVQKVLQVYSDEDNVYCRLHIEVVGDHFQS